MLKYEIREICGDWAIYEVRETETEGGERCLLILNSRSNAEYVKAILEHEARYPNAALPYMPEVAKMSDEECVAVNRLCCSGGHQCHACPLSGSESVEGTCFEVERRVNGLAERYVEAAHSPSPADGGSSLPEGASGADADDTNVGRKREWISVDERLPEDDLSEEHEKKTIKVLVAIKAKNGITIRTQERFRDYTYSNVGDPIFFWTWRFSRGKVTHWMPIPEPPKMKGGEER